MSVSTIHLWKLVHPLGDLGCSWNGCGGGLHAYGYLDGQEQVFILSADVVRALKEFFKPEVSDLEKLMIR